MPQTLYKIIAIIHQKINLQQNQPIKNAPYYIALLQTKRMTTLTADLSKYQTFPDVSSDKILTPIPPDQNEPKLVQQVSGISLKDKEFKKNSNEKLTQKGSLTQRTNHSSLAYNQQKQELDPQKNDCNDCYKEAEKKETKIPDLKRTQPTNLQRLKLIAAYISQLSHHIFTKFLIHLSKTSTADKYIRLVYSIVKLYRALYQKNNLSLISKELLTTRRILQWDSKYQLIGQLKDDHLSVIGFSYKIFEFIGSLFDFGSFWMALFAERQHGLADPAERMYCWQDDCYFYQCVVELVLAVKGLIKNLQMYLSQSYTEQKSFALLHEAACLKEREECLRKRVERIKCLDWQTTAPKIPIRRIFEDRIEQKLASKQILSREIEKAHVEWTQMERRKLQKQIIRSCTKVVKYICDVRTSYNNYSWRSCRLDPVLGGWLSLISSMLSIGLIWDS